LILVDTSVWIDFLKGTKSRQEIILKKLIEEEEDICITGIILTEILQGVKNDFKYKEIKKFLLALPIFFPKKETYIKAAEIYRKCRKTGITIRSTVDCLIAQIAIENDLILLHKDRDFDKIAEIIGKPELLR